MFFGSRNNLIKPGPSRSMADGWETRRRRGPGNDWAIIRLAAAGTIDRLESDTTHLRLSVFPDGGVARLRAWGMAASEPAPGLARLNAMSASEAATALRR